MTKDRIRGLVLGSGGAYLIALAFTLLAQPCGGASLSPTGPFCAVPRALTETTYFLASLGSSLLVASVWQAGIGRRKIVAEGAWLVIAVGTAVSTLGFLVSNLLPEVSTSSGEIGIILGMAGSSLLVGGVIKASVGQEKLSTPGTMSSPSSRLRKPVWSRREWTAFALLSIMIVAATAIGISVYQHSQSSCNYCGCGGIVTPCTGREAFNIESYTFNSPTNMTIEIRNTGSVAVTMVDYYVKDSAGDTYASTNWLGPTVSPNAVVQTSISVDGNAITFQAGNTYTITMITSRNNQFTFTILS